MKINGMVEFHSFVTSNGLSTIAPELAAFEVCMSEYNHLCACDDVKAKDAKLNQCRGFYMTFASHANDFKSILLSKTSDPNIILCINGQQICVINR
jgi:hypothetical protein